MAEDIDRLVELIADRVKARLGSGPLREQPCTEPPSNEACSGCGMCASRCFWSVWVIVFEGVCCVGAGVDTGKVDLEIARMIDHTLLKADATAEDVKKLCEEARKFCFASV